MNSLDIYNIYFIKTRNKYITMQKKTNLNKALLNYHTCMRMHINDQSDYFIVFIENLLTIIEESC